MPRNYILFAVLLVVVGVVALTMNRAPESAPTTTDESNVDVGTVTAILEDKEGNLITQDVTPRKPGELPQPIPSLSRAVTVPASLGAEAVKIASAQIAELQANLKKDPSSVEGWIKLGAFYKIATDFKGAEEAWLYAEKLNPSALVPHNNLADLYQGYLKQYALAEKQWAQVLRLDPLYTQGYLNLSDLYRYNIAEKKDQADDVLLSGLSKNPKNIDLMVALGRYYKETGNTASAKTYYEKALAEARVVKNDSLVKLLEADIAGLK